MKTRVGIVGAGPSGLLLAQILHNEGIPSVIIEHRSRDYVLERIRAGVIEPGAVATFVEHGVGDRLLCEGLPHQEMQLRWNGQMHRFNQVDEDGRQLTTYGQSAIVRDMIEAREAAGLPILWNAKVDTVEDIEHAPRIHFTRDGQAQTLDCDYVAGCDGFWGVTRGLIPDIDTHMFLKEYPFSWLGILTQSAPNPDKRGYAHSLRGMAVASSRSNTICRHYLQVPPETDVNAWSDDAIWDELDLRFADEGGETLNRGPILSKDVVRLRAFFCDRMRHGRLFIAGDAAHIVPPSGAKGLNLAVGDIRILAEAIRRHVTAGDSGLIENYDATCLQRIRSTVHWSNRLAQTLHIFPGQTDFDTQMQMTTLNKWAHTEAGNREFVQSALGEPYPV
ncbi:MAG: 4-hydroxybenzoate 3-monooxygenase [Rhodobacter sp.]|nr:4-hydroxybenzoate 3-monooxygenase [Paracoccaceae bacterium]MCC0077282.1 4-hydroxybenzoate 3-monooxygenase [Rhodobacter sp.]